MSEQKVDERSPLTKDGLTPLGHIKIPKDEFEADLEVLDRFQAFSAELLRISLLGIAGIGFFVSNILLRDRNQTNGQAAFSDAPSLYRVRFYLLASLICLGISAGCALLHRYFSSDSIAIHLQSLRMDLRQAAGDLERAERIRKKRGRQFWISGKMLGVSAILLWLGSLLLGYAFSLAL
jgi:hypothetical protein